MTDSLISVEWRPRHLPLQPGAVVARGAAARSMAARLLDRDDESLARLSGAIGDDLLLVIAPSDQLPWADGAVYLGIDPLAPALLIPTHSVPSVPVALLEESLRLRFPRLAPPIAVVPAFGALLSLESARPVARERLERWLAGHDVGREVA